MPAQDPLRTQTRGMARACIGMRARLLNRVVTQIFEEELGHHGVKLSQVNILVAVAELEPARPADVCAALCMEASTLSRNAERMRRQGWLALEAGDDGRSRRHRLTAAGRKLLTALHADWKRAQRRAERELGADVVDALMGFAQSRTS